jgi:hypothetical protein
MTRDEQLLNEKREEMRKLYCRADLHNHVEEITSTEQFLLGWRSGWKAAMKYTEDQK